MMGERTRRERPFRGRRPLTCGAWLGVFVTTAVLAATALTTDGCVIADPPTDLPRLAEMRPTIVRASVVPSMSGVIGRWPDAFYVPVEVSDPLVNIRWATFIDYDPVTGDGYVTEGTSPPDQSPADGRVRMLRIEIPDPGDQGCHVVEIVVALNLDTSDTKRAHTPQAPGGDIAMWLFNLSGDFAGCPIRDAGLVPVADAEAGTVDP